MEWKIQGPGMIGVNVNWCVCSGWIGLLGNREALAAEWDTTEQLN